MESWGCSVLGYLPLFLLHIKREFPNRLGILAGAAGNSLLKMSLYLRHTLRILCCKSLSPDDDEIDHDKTDTFKPWLRQPDTSDVLSQIEISGDKDLQQKTRKVCLKYRDIFSNELPAAQAKIPNRLGNSRLMCKRKSGR